MKRAVRTTRSVCPVCLENIPAELVLEDGVIYMEKTCHKHGSFSTPVWRGKLDAEAWRGGEKQLKAGEGESCPANCGICGEHTQGTCCALLEVTKRCDLHCRFCFANGGDAQSEPTLDELKKAIDDILRLGKKPLIQLSGGEPTVRDDLPELVAYAKAHGCPYVQLNSNGLRLAEDEEYVESLARAGLSFVFMQFDGVTDDVYEYLRGAPLLEKKLKAIENCDKHGLGVTLVPTVVRGVNDGQLGDIVRLGTALSPAVRGVHFQPVSFFGRTPGMPQGSDRVTLDELLFDMCRQSGLELDNFIPSRCDHPMCGFHGSFVVKPDDQLMALSKFALTEAARTTAEQNREYVARHWLRAAEPDCCCHGDDAEDGCCCEEQGEACCTDTEQGNSCCAEGEACTEAQDGCCCESEKTCRCETEAESCCSASNEEPCCCGAHEEDDRGGDMTDMDTFLYRAKKYAFTITAMAFQDAGNLDMERLRRCSLHVYHNGRLMPFCARYLTPAEI